MNVRIALAQVSAQQDKQKNLQKAVKFMKEASSKGAKLICFPEMSFDIFFPQYRAERKYFELAEKIPGKTVRKFQKEAKELNIITVFNMYEEDKKGEYYDCSPVINFDGKISGKSRMMHIAELPNYNEKFYYWQGNTGFPVYNGGGFCFGIAICYDRHYPEQLRALTLNGADLILVPTATSLPEFKTIWEVEMQAAAVTNQVYIAVVNKVGKDDNMTFFGGSFVVNPRGEVIARASYDDDELLLVDIDLNVIKETRNILPFLRDRRPEIYSILCEK
ncbi:carbon-nitrogen hydrolase family protein [candidate division KSB1 bacterium]|nr:MAG: carbon-nitrogen hydrolase family protein [candidate division KSB1 bacterium]